MTDVVIVRMKHIRAAKLCARGARAWFKKYGHDYSKFLTDGLPADELEATGCHYARKVCKIARNESAGTPPNG